MKANRYSTEDSIRWTREAILAGVVLDAAAQTPGLEVITEAERAQSIATMLATKPRENGIWVFGYGSLIWNPALIYDMQCLGVLHGWHRRFCLRTTLSRGTPEQPGLTLALERGGACKGILYRISSADIERELTVLWRREMPDRAYLPRWMNVNTVFGRLRAISFTVNRASSRYVSKLEANEVARTIAHAIGRAGRCSDYLQQTVSALNAYDITDRKLSRLNEKVQALIQSGNLQNGSISYSNRVSVDNGLSTELDNCTRPTGF